MKHRLEQNEDRSIYRSYQADALIHRNGKSTRTLLDSRKQNIKHIPECFGWIRVPQWGLGSWIQTRYNETQVSTKSLSLARCLGYGFPRGQNQRQTFRTQAFYAMGELKTEDFGWVDDSMQRRVSRAAYHPFLQFLFTVVSLLDECNKQLSQFLPFILQEVLQYTIYELSCRERLRYDCSIAQSLSTAQMENLTWISWQLTLTHSGNQNPKIIQMEDKLKDGRPFWVRCVMTMTWVGNALPLSTGKSAQNLRI